MFIHAGDESTQHLVPRLSVRCPRTLGQSLVSLIEPLDGRGFVLAQFTLVEHMQERRDKLGGIMIHRGYFRKPGGDLQLQFPLDPFEVAERETAERIFFTLVGWVAG
jgi:hypothetical protein